MKVNFLDLKASYAPLKSEIDTAVGGIFDRCDFVLGGPVKQFEADVREYCGSPFSLGVANGTDALIIALRAAGIGKGDAVITTPFTFVATAESIHESGARPIFCDISPETYNLDAAAVEKYIQDNCDLGGEFPIDRASGARVRAVLPVHLYGLMADMRAFMALREKYNIGVIEDAAQSFGATIDMGDGKPAMAGTIGDAGCYSFYPSKNLGGAGDGGMIVTGRQDIQEMADMLHVHGSRRRYYHDDYGYNSRLDSLQAAVLSIRLKHLDKWIARRRENAKLYTETLKATIALAGYTVLMSDDVPDTGVRPEHSVVLPTHPEHIHHTFNILSIRVPRRDDFQKFLAEREIGSCIYYPLAMHNQSIFEHLGYSDGDFPVCAAVCSDIISIPQYPELPHEHIAFVAETVGAFLKSLKDNNAEG